MNELEELSKMLAERVVEWTKEWKQLGINESAETLREVLIAELEQRFGPLPTKVYLRVKTTGTIRKLAKLLVRSGTAPSLDAVWDF